jgi:hypothetical protein
VTATDGQGNHVSVQYSTRIDNQPPVIGTLTATNNGQNVLNTGTVLQGAVNITVDATDNCGLSAAPDLTLVNGATTNTAACTGTNSSTYSYTWTVGPSTPNGLWTATVTANDLCHNTVTNFTLNVNATQIAGSVQLEGFIGTSRTVVFAATDGTSAVLKRWTNNVTGFANTPTASFTLTGVPAGTVSLSAKTAWNLRSKVTVAYDGNGQGTANFTGVGGPGTPRGGLLRGGDLNGDNVITGRDYTTLGNNLFSNNTVADINGSGSVTQADYNIFAGNWNDPYGDPE